MIPKTNYFSFFTDSRKKSKQFVEKLKKILLNKSFVEKKEGEFIFVLGGDGTLLKIIKKFKNFQNKFFIVCKTKHSFNFWANFNKEELFSFFSDFSQKKFQEKFSLINVPLITITFSFGDKKYEINALNEVKFLQLECTFNYDFLLSNFSYKRRNAGGLIITSALGSGAYNNSTGGSIILSKKWKELFLFREFAPANHYVNFNVLFNSFLLTKDELVKLRIKTKTNKNFYFIADNNIFSSNIKYERKKIGKLERIKNFTISFEKKIKFLVLSENKENFFFKKMKRLFSS